MKLEAICFTAAGQALGRRLTEPLREQGVAYSLTAGFGPGKTSLRVWTDAAWRESNALLFIGAAGIAVRAIAPLVASKTRDPAVLVMDEAGRFCIPLLSGHIGGANALARRIAGVCDAQVVLTTATDVRGMFAVDSWAVSQGLTVANPERIQAVSSKLLAGGEVLLSSEFSIAGVLPAGVRLCALGETPDVAVSIYTRKDRALLLIPRAVTLGIGCRRGIAAESLETAWQSLLQRTHLAPEAVRAVRSIDLKKEEPGLLAFCERHQWALQTFSAETLRALPGHFTASNFVASVTGVDNVCERAAVCGGGQLLLPKAAEKGVTMALGIFPMQLYFSK